MFKLLSKAFTLFGSLFPGEPKYIKPVTDGRSDWQAITSDFDTVLDGWTPYADPTVAIEKPEDTTKFMTREALPTKVLSLSPCSLCQGEGELLIFHDLSCYMMQCKSCKVVLGMPYGYSSRSIMYLDWHSDAHLAEAEIQNVFMLVSSDANPEERELLEYLYETCKKDSAD